MISFHNDTVLKDGLIQEILKHEELDQIVQGTYGEQNGGWKGCAVGCSIRSFNLLRGKKHPTDDHKIYETEFGIPRILARLEDRIFEGMSVEDAKKFPYRFMSAVPVGKDLTSVWKKFLVWLLVDEEEGVIQHAKNDDTKKAIQDVANLIEKSLTENITPEQFMEVQHVARAAAAADAAADAAAAADADDDAAAADAAADAADAAADAAAAAAADAAAAVYAVARKRKYKRMGDKLIELLESA